MEKKRLEYNGKARDIENKGIKMVTTFIIFLEKKGHVWWQQNQ